MKFNSDKCKETNKIETEMYFMYTKEQFYEVDAAIGASKRTEVKLQRAHGECLGIRSR